MIAAYSRNTERGAAAIIARRRKEELERRRQARIAELERRERERMEAKRREMERRERERGNAEEAARRADQIIRKYREILIGEKVYLPVRDIITVAVDGTGYTHEDIIGQRRMRAMTNIRHYAAHGGDKDRARNQKKASTWQPKENIVYIDVENPFYSRAHVGTLIMKYFAMFDEAGFPTAFYCEEIHGDAVPPGAIEISEDQWRDFIDNSGQRR